MTTPARGALRYYGGKWQLGPWIIEHLPPHACYVEPFCGAASVLLQKQPSRIEVLNDLDGEIVNFFQVLRACPDDLIRAIDLTPFARAEATLACEPDEPTRDPVERARRLYVRSGQTRHGAPRPSGRTVQMGWRYERQVSGGATNAEMWGRTEHLWDVAARLKSVQLECGEALRIIERFDSPGTVFYVDPPYVAVTRGARWASVAYAVELSTADHQRLAESLHRVAGMVVLSGYPSALYEDLYRDWRRVDRDARKQTREASVECLWLSPNCMVPQPSLFDEVAG